MLQKSSGGKMTADEAVRPTLQALARHKGPLGVETSLRELVVRYLALVPLLLLATSSAFPQTPVQTQDNTWQGLIRSAPLWESQGVQQNLETIRRWVLGGEGYCNTPDRHILFDRRMRFAGYLSDVGGREAN
jgi:hypothetical protein